MGFLRVIYKMLMVLVMLVVAFFIVLGGSILRLIRIVTTSQIQKLVKIWYQTFLKVMDISVHLSSANNNQQSDQTQCSKKGSVVVANHISWLDIVVLGSIVQTHFLSKAEVRRWPLIGWLAHQIGTLFIQRGGGGDVEGLKRKMLDYVNTGQNILFFPEGTTGFGDNLLVFRPRLFSTAIDSKTCVTPISLKYGKQNSPHPVVPYTKEETLIGNLVRVMAHGHIDVYVEMGSPLESDNKNRDQLSIEAQNKIAAMLDFSPDQVTQRFQRKPQSTSA